MIRPLTLGFFLLSGFGCAVTQKVDAALDCNGICDRYKSCFDNDYDASACAASCRNKASEDTSFRRKADVCNACIHERSCTQATFACAAECISVVP